MAKQVTTITTMSDLRIWRHNDGLHNSSMVKYKLFAVLRALHAYILALLTKKLRIRTTNNRNVHNNCLSTQIVNDNYEIKRKHSFYKSVFFSLRLKRPYQKSLLYNDD